MRYADRRGRNQRLTPEQAVYLGTGRLRQYPFGWGGLRSTQTVRLLRERGLLTLRESPSYPRWTVTGLTTLGEEVLDRWNARRNARMEG